MRRLVLALLVPLAGCADPGPDPDAPPVDPETARLLEAIDRDALADAFARLEASGARADLTLTTQADGDETRETLAVDPTATTEDEGPRLRDPLVGALTDDPPYLDPAAREAYRLRTLGDTTIGGERLRLVEAVLEDTDREHGVRRVWAAVDGAGRLGAVEVERRADSAIYAETSRVRVDLRPTPEGWLPRRVLTDTRTDVPLSAPTRVRAEWTVRAQPGA